MTKLMLRMIALTGLSAGALRAQNITGVWQGTLKSGPGEFRVVIKISLDDDHLKAVTYTIDLPGPGMAASAITRDGSSVRLAVSAIQGKYEGKLSADGNSIAGTWTQGGSPMVLNLTRTTSETAWAIPEPPKLMPADADPVFEVATIKPSNHDWPGKLFSFGGRDFTTINTSLSDLITDAYDLQPRQITGAPKWIETEKYDLTGRPDVEGQPNPRQLKMMLQKPLADRFQLTFHRDKKEFSVYAITVGKTGAKLTKSEADANGRPTVSVGAGFVLARNTTIAELASSMQVGVIDRPVVDQTGLTGKYDFTLTWTPDAAQSDNLEAPPDLFTAFQQQLGLKLESTKAPVDVLVIDHVEKPSDN